MSIARSVVQRDARRFLEIGIRWAVPTLRNYKEEPFTETADDSTHNSIQLGAICSPSIDAPFEIGGSARQTCVSNLGQSNSSVEKKVDAPANASAHIVVT
jgi:hypothetical protein